MDQATQSVRLSWTEPANLELWGGDSPTLSVEFDEENAFLLNVSVAYNRRRAVSGRALSPADLRAAVFKVLNDAEVFVDDSEVQKSEEGIVAM